MWLGRSLGYDSLAFTASAVSQGACSFRREGAAVGSPPPAGYLCRRLQPPPPLPGEATPPPAAEECEEQAPHLITAYPELVDLRLPDTTLLPAAANWTDGQHAAVLQSSMVKVVT